MKKTILSMIITLCLAISSFNVALADDYDYYNTSYGTWYYYHATQINSTAQPDFNEVGVTIGGINVPIPNSTGAVSFIYQFNNCYSGSLTITFDASVDGYYKMIYGDYGAKINYTNGNTLNVSVIECTRLEIVIIGTGYAKKVNSVNHTLTAVNGNSQIDYSNQLSNIYQILSYIDTYVSNIESNTDNLEGYVDSIESYIDGIENTLSTINSQLSNIYSALTTSNYNVSNINSNIINIYTLLNNLDVRFGNSLSNIVSNTDNLDTLLSSISNTLLVLLNKSLSYVPTYSLSAYRWFNGFNNDGIAYDTYNYPSIRVRTTGDGTGFNGNRRIQLKPSETLLLSFLCTQNITFENFPYYILDNKSGTVNYSYKRIGATYYIINITVKNNNTSSLSISFDYVPNTSMNVVPLYLGDVQLMSDEIQMITQFYANNSPDYTNDIDHISQLLEDIGLDVSNLSIDNSTLVTAINNLNASLSDLSSSINITNNIDISNIPPYSVNAYYWFGKFNNNGIVNDIYQYPNMYINNTVTGSYDGNRRLYVQAHRQLIIAVISSVSLTASNFPYYFNDSNVSQYVSVAYSVKSFADRRYQYVVITNDSNSTITISFDYTGTGFRIVPFYIGYVDLMTDDLAMITQYTLPSTNEPYYSVLNDIYDAISNLDLNVSVDVTNEQVQNVTNNFDTNIEIVNNVEVDFNTSFEDTNALITDTDLSLDFDGLLSGIDVYHSIFSHFYNYSFFKYISIVCLVGGVILVLLG